MKLKKKDLTEEDKNMFEVATTNFIKNKKEKEYSGNYCRETFKNHKEWKKKLSKEELEEYNHKILIDEPEKTLKLFNSLKEFDVIGCVTWNRIFYPKSFIITKIDYDEQKIFAIPWNSNWINIKYIEPFIKEIKEKYRLNHSACLESEITFEDLSLSQSIKKFTKLYNFNKNKNIFEISNIDEMKKIKIITVNKNSIS